MDVKLLNYIYEDLKLQPLSIKSTIELLDAGSTVPFIARYRKERTGGLDEVQIRDIESKYEYYVDLEKRKITVVESIKEQGKLTQELAKQIELCREKQRLEDIYLPFKPKKRTRATDAKDKGLEPLADIIWKQETLTGKPQDIAVTFVNTEKGVKTADDALAGARDIIAERIVENAEVRNAVRQYIYDYGVLFSEVKKEFAEQKTKFEMYYKYNEPIKKAASHRILAIRRGFKEEVLRWRIEADQALAVKLIEEKVITNKKSIFHYELLRAIDEAYERSLFTSLELETFTRRVTEGGTEAISVFSENLKNLLLTPPAGHKVIMGIDPGFRTGCKVAVVDTNGNFKEYMAIFPHPPVEEVRKAADVVLALIKKYKVELIAIGNGTASKETDAFVRALLKREQLGVRSIVVSEAGASVYSASEIAGKEFPDLDVTVRGAISIARRLQDPLAELVKIDAKSIGVGQYQHDVNQSELKKSLDARVESCVNYVGAELNTASAALLSYISGIGPSIAKNIVDYRAKNGSFKDKKQLKDVPKLGEKAFEQCAGFLRIVGGVNPLDNSAIHPERYAVVEAMAKDLGVTPRDLIANEKIIAKISVKKYVTADVGEPTLLDIVDELRKPGCDPREEFSSMEYREDINTLEDLKEDMVLDGTVTNVTNFGAFVDIGVHQDGLVHISQLADRFVNNPHDVAAVGDRVKVRVVSVDKQLKRIGLSMKGLGNN
jgi:uncharacterized protein